MQVETSRSGSLETWLLATKQKGNTMEEQQYKVVAVRLTLEQAEFLQAQVDHERDFQKGYRMSNLLRAIISEWIEEN
jgi:hypothetical protein